MATINESASTVDLVLVQGDDWIKSFRLGSRPTVDAAIEYWDLTGWTGKSQIRKKATSVELLAELTVEIPDQTDPDLTGVVTVSLLAADAADLPSACMWDLELTNTSGIKKTYLAGSVTVNREVTRSA